MSGKPINSEQVKMYMDARANNTTHKKASAQSGISERSGRRIEKGELQPTGRKKRNWRTREDPFRNVWDSEIVPLLNKGIQGTQYLILFPQTKVNIFPLYREYSKPLKFGSVEEISNSTMTCSPRTARNEPPST